MFSISLKLHMFTGKAMAELECPFLEGGKDKRVVLQEVRIPSV